MGKNTINKGYWTEVKVKPRKWKFKYTYVTKNNKRIKPGQYKITAVQKARKISLNTYKLTMTGKRKRI
jgi:hypothetical protein